MLDFPSKPTSLPSLLLIIIPVGFFLSLSPLLCVFFGESCPNFVLRGSQNCDMPVLLSYNSLNLLFTFFIIAGIAKSLLRPDAWWRESSTSYDQSDEQHKKRASCFVAPGRNGGHGGHEAVRWRRGNEDAVGVLRAEASLQASF